MKALEIVDIAKGISWTSSGHFYLELKDNKYELLVDYLNASNIECLDRDICTLKSFQDIRITGDMKKIEDFIMTELEGFGERENGYSAYLAGAHDKSASVHYNIEHDTISLFHPNVSTLEKLIIEPHELIHLSNQMIEIFKLKKHLKFGED